ncbi:NAD(P)-dependent alcohol dehydrogenase [Salinibacterium sp. dk2585]|uniref:NAD(P)-dependent alcohol dehydrogenase n=1 Tax=unclassified Salinibacterium TaxID=2632331 RepID=UPI0011C24E90|nr:MULTISPECIES: NAD(P)-dependent alcohol dehydrogenase [unclassified Salinibacterium]QEE60251.1 NAD(P)-dependent alcohol dehydrogenase [Salinibacterium sp. dk2585]TXK55323.1 NAD(P)-dependent alcohol dehydrogenase [Salinibacterium sp. dk5596]
MNAQATAPTTMTAWAQHHYGGPETVESRTIDVPAPAKGEVLLKVCATSINAGDIRVMRGDPMLVRAVFGLRRPRVGVRGMDVSGTVISTGPGVDDWSVGDEVVGQLPGGGLAPYVIAPVKRLVRRPATVSAALASTLPIAGGTAWQALESTGVRAGSRVLVIGASGGVGTFAVQLAALRGAEVWALCGPRNSALVEALGAARTFDSRSTDLAAFDAASFDQIIDIVGTTPLPTLQRRLREGGALSMIAGTGGRVFGPMGRILQAGARSIGSPRKLKALTAMPKREVLAELVQLVADGKLMPVVEREYPMHEADDALRHVDAGHTVGKVVVLAE